LLALIDTSAAIAQTVGSQNPSAPPPSTTLDKQLLPQAPVGHRQPRADQVPPESNLNNPNDAANREDAMLDRKIKSICRGCLTLGSPLVSPGICRLVVPTHRRQRIARQQSAR
jgi:hypothetical protein